MNYIVIENALPADLLSAMAAAIQAGPFESGKLTAHGLAQAAKHNLQLANAEHTPLLDSVAAAIHAHPVVQAFALPRAMGRTIINRYEVGMEYGLHADAAYIQDVRTDVSFTLFLDDPVTYQGGELVISTAAQTFTFKLPAGSIVLYPAGALHRVTPVIQGVRHAVVGWLQSRIRDAHQREVIAKLSLVPRTLSQDPQHAALVTQTGQCIQELIRMWGD
ncbi:Fe2+-dependent dioxygenase [Stutzerimonas stutzeri]|uniref:Fe2+-dependent dioxygenase n=1 Tax=Stutzerimonas stutzeri TaxID=316 RepID=UPI002108B404|nr:Fe2+-dependent dioxygenase [Stutzerimonas stutzeri]